MVSVLRLITGVLLGVFGHGEKTIVTRNATIGVRGTGLYLDTAPQQTYFCTCYGITDIASGKDKNSRETVQSTHHDARYILANAASGKNVRKAPFINHTDSELMLIETLVGRQPPFVFPSDDYKAPRREY